jgi:Domain of unknown function (DUF4190)
VAIEQKSSVIDTEHDDAGTVIENEIPSYRAISARAIFCLVCGVLSVFCFAHPIFYSFSILAVVLGIWAHRTIRRFPDMLTGQGLASTGIGLAVLFGGASLTITSVQHFVRTRQARLFAVKYAQVLEAGDMSNILWYNSHPESRKDKTGADIARDIDSKPKEKQMMMSTMGPLAQLHKLQSRITESKGQKVNFVELEGVGEDDGHGLEMQIYALCLYEIVGPPSEKFPKEKEYSLVILKARPSGREYEWWTDSVVYPYTPSSYKAPAKPVGDSHGGEEGHAH